MSTEDIKDGRPDLLMEAMGIIANASDWGSHDDPKSLEWRAAAIRWRDRFHEEVLTPEPEPSDYADNIVYGVVTAPSIQEDPWFRQRCLELSIQNCTPGCSSMTTIRKAEAFEQYIKGEK